MQTSIRLLLAGALLMSNAVSAATFSDAQICRAGIATNNGHAAKPVIVTSTTGRQVEVSYVRPSDKKTFRFRCSIEDSEILWQDEYIGRWSQNLRLFYRVDSTGKTLEVRSVIKGEENNPTIRKFTLQDL